MHDNYPPTSILPYLVLGAECDSLNSDVLDEFGITHILNVKESARFPGREGVSFLHIPLSNYGDSALIDILDPCCDFIDQAHKSDGCALVHCHFGSNRAPSVVIGYLVKRLGWSVDKAYQELSSMRSLVSLHKSYLRQLRQIESAAN